MDKQNIDQFSFFELASRRKYIVEKASFEDISRGIDFYVKGKYQKTKKEVNMLFAVKRKKSQNYSKYHDRWIWIEYKKHKDRPGWIYGPSHFIAFERSKDFVIINRKVLLDHINSKHCKVRWDSPFVADSRNAKYRIYQNPRNGSQISQILIKDIMNLEGVAIWKKNGE
tara:strand:- start:2299 stop:2805 length:507 start_codon:yes stop_codon:yes gene_type:complete